MKKLLKGVFLCPQNIPAPDPNGVSGKFMRGLGGILYSEIAVCARVSLSCTETSPCFMGRFSWSGGVLSFISSVTLSKMPVNTYVTFSLPNSPFRRAGFHFCYFIVFMA